MTIDEQLCTSLDQLSARYDTYVPQAVLVAVGPWVDAPAGSAASAVLSLEILHRDAVCQTPLADACVHVVSRDDDVRFVAPGVGAADNFVSCWHREHEPSPQSSGWAPASPGQTSRNHEVLLLGQTLPNAIADFPESGAGAGYLHYQPDRPTDGWTVRIGVLHPRGPQGLKGQAFEIAVAVRPYWSSTTAFQLVTAP